MLGNKTFAKSSKQRLDKPLTRYEPLPRYEPVSYIPKYEKIIRIAAVMNNATQREYFDNSLFERLPQAVMVYFKTNTIKNSELKC